jgi:hypothetical protein
MGEWTKEPWRVEWDDNGFYHMQAEGRPSPYLFATGGDWDGDMIRAAVCVNAMRGIEDPAALMDEVREVLGPLAAYGKVLRGQLVQADATVIELWDHKITVGQLIAVADLLDKIGGGE